MRRRRRSSRRRFGRDAWRDNALSRGSCFFCARLVLLLPALLLLLLLLLGLGLLCILALRLLLDTRTSNLVSKKRDHREVLCRLPAALRGKEPGRMEGKGGRRTSLAAATAAPAATLARVGAVAFALTVTAFSTSSRTSHLRLLGAGPSNRLLTCASKSCRASSSPVCFFFPASFHRLLHSRSDHFSGVWASGSSMLRSAMPHASQMFRLRRLASFDTFSSGFG
jgi:hypothetical protein